MEWQKKSLLRLFRWSQAEKKEEKDEKPEKPEKPETAKAESGKANEAEADGDAKARQKGKEHVDFAESNMKNIIKH